MFNPNYRKIIDDLNFDVTDMVAINNLSRILDRTVEGSSEVLTSPLANETSTEDILLGWDKIFNSSSNLSKMNSTLRGIEENNRSKYGPRSIAKPWLERRDSLVNYFGKTDVGSDLVLDLKQARRLRPLSYDVGLRYLKNNSNSGAPFFVKKQRVKDAILPSFVDLFLRDDPALLFTRTQEDNKTRDVWGYPVLKTLFEMCYYRPILEHQRKLSFRAALNKPDDVDRSITKLIDIARLTNKDILSIDFSSYDASVKEGLHKSCFKYFESLYQPGYERDFNIIQDWFTNIGIITPEGIWKGPHGVPSGSTFTNEVDSMAQYLIANQCEAIHFLDLCQIQGDDGVYLTDNSDDVRDCFTDYGLKVNEKKSDLSQNYAIYLQSLYHTDYRRSDGLIRGIYSTYRALLRIVYLERFDDFKDDLSGKDYFAIRTISILENCKAHPLFKELVEYIYKLDKYNLSISDQGLYSYVKRQNRQEGLDITFRNWTYGEDIRGIKSFESYKIIQELSR